MKLEKNMYVRTDREIFKFLKVDEKGTYRRTLSSDNESVTTGFEIEDVKKASHNIIDLIEVGDYVNGSRVIKTNCKLEYIDDDSDTGVNEVYDGLELENGWIYFEHEINSIVTKEQFESMSYKVEG